VHNSLELPTLLHFLPLLKIVSVLDNSRYRERMKTYGLRCVYLVTGLLQHPFITIPAPSLTKFGRNVNNSVTSKNEWTSLTLRKRSCFSEHYCLHADGIEVKFVSLWILLEVSHLNYWPFLCMSAVTTCRREADGGRRLTQNNL
jgi:hypothetical protein